MDGDLSGRLEDHPLGSRLDAAVCGQSGVGRLEGVAAMVGQFLGGLLYFAVIVGCHWLAAKGVWELMLACGYEAGS